MSRGGRWRSCQAQIRPIQIVVWLPGNFRCDVEIFRWWRRIGYPLEARRRPRVLPGTFAVAHGPSQVNHRQKIAERENRSARGGQHVEHLEFRRIGVIAARHSEVAKNELREERKMEADKQGASRNPRQHFRIEPAVYFWPPEVNAADVTHDRAAHHDVVEMGDHKVGVMNMNVQAEAGEEEAGKAADDEEADETEGVEHGRVPGDGTFVEGRGPVEDLNRRRDGHQVAEEGKSKRGVGGFAGDKHVVGPDQETDDGDGDTGTGDEGVAEDGLARKGGDDFADHTHGRKNHDVHGGERIEPEEMLEENGIAAESGIEKAEMKHALKASEQKGDGDNGRAENNDQAGGGVRPNKQRTPKPRHSAAP